MDCTAEVVRDLGGGGSFSIFLQHKQMKGKKVFVVKTSWYVRKIRWSCMFAFWREVQGSLPTQLIELLSWF
jgi:hypothetical protein